MNNQKFPSITNTRPQSTLNSYHFKIGQTVRLDKANFGLKRAKLVD